MKTQITHCGIDVGLRNHRVCLLDERQQVVKKFTIINDRDGFEELERYLNKNTLICIEPTGIYSINLFIYLKKRNWDIKLCGTVSSSHFRRSLFGKKKHDNLDCEALAKYRITHEHMTLNDDKYLERVSQETASDKIVMSSTLLEILNKYHKITKQGMKLKTGIKLIIDLRFPEAIQIFTTDRGSKTIMKMLCHEKQDILDGKVKLLKIDIIRQRLERTIGQYDLKVSEFKHLVGELENVESQKKILKSQIKLELEKYGYGQLLDQTGFAVINLAVLVSEIKDIKRFYRFNKDGTLNKKNSLKSLKEFAGLTVTSNQSGSHDGGHKLVKSGNKKLRTTLFMMALTFISLKECSIKNEENGLNALMYLQLYNKWIKKTKKKIALTKVMSKIVVDLFFLFKALSEKQRAPETEVVSHSQASSNKVPALF